MPRTPLVAPDGYFARDDAFAPWRALLVVLAFWLVDIAVTVAWWLVPDVGYAWDAETVVSRLGSEPIAYRTVRMTVLYWLVPATVLYVLGYLRSGADRPFAGLVLGAWWLARGLLAWLGSNLFLLVSYVLEFESPLPGGSVILLPLAGFLLATGWAAYVWRAGLEHAFDLDRSTATSTAVLAAGVCALLLVLEAGPAFV